MFTIPELAKAFELPEQEVRAQLYAAGFSPCDYGFDGCTPQYDRAAAEWLADHTQPQVEQAPAPAAPRQTYMPATYLAKMAPGDNGSVRCEL